MGYPQALDYSALKAVVWMMNIPKKERPDLLRRVRAIEHGAVKALRKLIESRAK